MSGDSCGTAYPYDPRNLSLGGIFRNQGTTYYYTQSGLPTLQINVPPNLFYSVNNQAAANLLACECAAAKAVALGYTNAICES